MKADPGFTSTFCRLKEILQKEAGALSVAADTPDRYCLEANIGPATIRAWGGKKNRPKIPVAWVEIRKAYVSYHLMGVTNPIVHECLSKALRARMQGKRCFKFTTADEALLKELETVTSRSITSFKKAGFIAS